MAITALQRKKAETLIYTYMDELDRTKTNSSHYKEIFAKLSDDQFESMFKQEFPLRFHIAPFKIEPTFEDVENSLKVLNVPMLEKINMPYVYRDEKGTPVKSKDCQVGYIHHNRVQQIVTKKNAMSTNISQRDMRSGLLINYDKNGKTSDRELEAMITMGLDAPVKEFSTFKADSMNAKSIAYSVINNKGVLSMQDIPIDQTDSLSKNMFNVYMIGSMLYCNILTDSYLLPYYAERKKTVIQRI